MPQLEFSTYASQLVWLTITFLVLYIYLARSALPKVTDILEERASRISNDLEQAGTLRKEAEKLEQSYEKLLAEARAEASRSMSEAREALNRELEARRAKHDEKLNARLAEAEKAIARAKAAAMDEVADIAAGACRDIVAKVAGIEVEEKSARTAVKQRLN